MFALKKFMKELVLLVENSLGVEIEYDDYAEEYLFRSSQNLTGQAIPLFSGKISLSLAGVSSDIQTVRIKSNGPLPLQINALAVVIDQGG